MVWELEKDRPDSFPKAMAYKRKLTYHPHTAGEPRARYIPLEYVEMNYERMFWLGKNIPTCLKGQATFWKLGKEIQGCTRKKTPQKN